MVDDKSKELKVKDKQELTSHVEQTKSGPVFTPAVDILETEYKITMMADLPGVKTEDLNIDLNEDVLTIAGDVARKETLGDDILTEYKIGQYIRKFNLSEVIDQTRISATLNNGVLHLDLPKVEKTPPRKIAVTVG